MNPKKYGDKLELSGDAENPIAVTQTTIVWGERDQSMRINFTDKQNEAMDAIASELYDFILFGGAMGGGKTFLGLSALLIMCELFPKSRWCVIRENLEKIRITTIPSFKNLAQTAH